MPTPLDHEFVRAVAGAADRLAAPLAAGPDAEPAGVTHRALARRVKTLVAAYRSTDSALHGSRQVVSAMMAHLGALRAAQTTTGLFGTGSATARSGSRPASRQANRSPGRTGATYYGTTRGRTRPWSAPPTRRPGTASTSVGTALTR